MGRSRSLLVGLVVVVLTATATVALAVGLSVTDPWDEPLPSRGALDGQKLVATEVVGRRLLPGTQLTVGFELGGIGADAGCNNLSGGYEVKHGKLRLIQAMQTMMTCGPSSDRQETWVFDVLDGATVEQRGSTLLVRAGTAAITLEPRLDPDDPRAVVGRWWLRRYADTGAAPRKLGYGPSRGNRPFLLLSDRIGTIRTPCRATDVDVLLGDAAVQLVTSRSRQREPRTRRCKGERAQVDRVMTEVLQGRVAVTRSGPLLTVRSGDASLQFERYD